MKPDRLAPEGLARFASRFPVVWHVAEADGLAAIEALGLLPTAELRQRAGMAATGQNRDDYVPLSLPGAGTAILGFQLMADAKIAGSLAGEFAGQPAAWRALIDSHVFFWPDPARRDGFARATERERRKSPAAPSDTPPVVLAFDTLALVTPHLADAYYSTFNTGSTIRGAARARRDEHTFRPVAAYRSGPVAELAIRAAIPPEVLARARLP